MTALNSSPRKAGDSDDSNNAPLLSRHPLRSTVHPIPRTNRYNCPYQAEGTVCCLRDRQDGRGFEVLISRFPKPRTPNFESRLSRISRATDCGTGGPFHHPARKAFRYFMTSPVQYQLSPFTPLTALASCSGFTLPDSTVTTAWPFMLFKSTAFTPATFVSASWTLPK